MQKQKLSSLGEGKREQKQGGSPVFTFRRREGDQKKKKRWMPENGDDGMHIIYQIKAFVEQTLTLRHERSSHFGLEENHPDCGFGHIWRQQRGCSPLFSSLDSADGSLLLVSLDAIVPGSSPPFPVNFLLCNVENPVYVNIRLYDDLCSSF